MMRRLFRLAAASFLLCLTLPAPAVAQQTEEDDVETEAVSPIRKGVTEWGLHFGFGVAENTGEGFGDRQLVSAGGRVGWVLSEPLGPGFLRGHFEISVDVVPLFLVLQEDASYGFHTAVTFRHYFAPSSRARPFLTVGSGPLFTTNEVPKETSRFNFASSLGLGVVFPKGGRSVISVEARIHHISNADTAESNPGMNSLYVQVGVSLYR